MQRPRRSPGIRAGSYADSHALTPAAGRSGGGLRAPDDLSDRLSTDRCRELEERIQRPGLSHHRHGRCDRWQYVRPFSIRNPVIEILAHQLLHRFRRDSARRIHGFTPDAIAAMNRHTWLGNVRELINRVRRAIVMAGGKLISAENLDLAHFRVQPPVTLAQAPDRGSTAAALIPAARSCGRARHFTRDALPVDGYASPA